MTLDQEKTIKSLHDLVATCNDASEGYGKAAKGMHDSDLSNYLAQVSRDRDGYAAELTRAIGQLGGQPANDLHAGGILHRGWVDLEQSLRHKDQSEILRECIAGDTGTLAHYDTALGHELPADLRRTILEQRTSVDDVLVALQQKHDRHKAHHA